MQIGEEGNVDDAVAEIAMLLAVAYRRRAKIRLVATPLETSLPSTFELAKGRQRSVHELRLTSQRKELPRS